MTASLTDQSLAWLVRRAATNIDDRPWTFKTEYRDAVMGARHELAGRLGHERADRIAALTRGVQEGGSPGEDVDVLEAAIALSAVARSKQDYGHLSDGDLRAYGRFDELAARNLHRLLQGAEDGFKADVHASRDVDYRKETWGRDKLGRWNVIAETRPRTPYTFTELAERLRTLLGKHAVERAENAEAGVLRQSAEAERVKARASEIKARADRGVDAAKRAVKAAQAAAKLAAKTARRVQAVAG